MYPTPHFLLFSCSCFNFHSQEKRFKFSLYIHSSYRIVLYCIALHRKLEISSSFIIYFAYLIKLSGFRTIWAFFFSLLSSTLLYSSVISTRSTNHDTIDSNITLGCHTYYWSTNQYFDFNPTPNHIKVHKLEKENTNYKLEKKNGKHT